MIRSFAVLVVIDAVRLNWGEWKIDVLSVQQGPSVGILRLNVLQQLIDPDVRRNVLRVRSQDVEQLLINRVLTRSSAFWELILAGVGVEETRAGLLHRSKWFLAKVHIIFIVIERGRWNENIIAEVIFLIVFVELFMWFFLWNLR